MGFDKLKVRNWKVSVLDWFSLSAFLGDLPWILFTYHVVLQQSLKAWVV